MLRLLALCALLMSSAALARDDGRFAGSNPEIKSWIRALKNQDKVGCCDVADGYPADVEWDTKNSSYRVRIEGEWYVVPPEAVLTEPNRLGYAMVWFFWSYEEGVRKAPRIRCFLPGAGG